MVDHLSFVTLEEHSGIVSCVLIVLRHDDHWPGLSDVWVVKNKNWGSDETEEAGDDAEEVSGGVAWPGRSDEHDADAGVDDSEDQQRETGDDEVIVVEDIVVVSEVGEVDQDEAEDDPHTDQDVGRNC